MYRLFGIPFLSIVLTSLASPSSSTAQSAPFNFEDLQDIQILSVSKREEKLLSAASAIDVLTSDDIRRSMGLTLPEALRDAVGLHVANATGLDYAISARGMNSVNANKMEVVIDGRSVYSPLFSGVYWDSQDTILEDIDRIEVIRSPGAALWGPNAVNGVINVYTKPASQTQGALVSVAAGTEETFVASTRYGFELAPETHVRVYGKFFTFDHAKVQNTNDSISVGWELGRAGFRIDSESLPQSRLTVIGEIYSNSLDIYRGSPNSVEGSHLLGRFVHEFDDQSALSIQTYFEKSHRSNLPFSYETRETYDLNLSYNFNVGERHNVVAGLGLRSSSDNTISTYFLSFVPPSDTIRTFNVYLHDEIEVSRNRFYVTLGAMLVDNTYVDWEVQPTVRARFHPNPGSTIWAAVSRAVRVPARVDAGVIIGDPITNLTYGSLDYQSEELMSYELGYRFQPHPTLFFDIAGYYNSYDQLRSLEPHPTEPRHFIFGNLMEGRTRGAEALVSYTPFYWMKLELSGTMLSKSFNYKRESEATAIAGEGIDPGFITSLRTTIELPYQLEADLLLRHTDDMSENLPDHLALDARLSWAPRKDLELSIVGRNLLEDSHKEHNFYISRTVYAKVVARF